MRKARGHVYMEKGGCVEGDTLSSSMETWKGMQSFHLFQDLACFSKHAHCIRVAFPVPGGRREGGNSQDQEM